MIQLWKSLVLSKLDYCGQLWSPSEKVDGYSTNSSSHPEILHQKNGRHQAREQLKKLRLYSLRRRWESYMIIYTWRILEREVPIIGEDGIVSSNHIYRGRTCLICRISKAAPMVIQKQAYASFTMHGPHPYNIMPMSIRNLKNCPVDHMKRQLDKFLATVPDESQIHGYTVQRRAEINSLLDMVQIADALHRQERGDCQSITSGSHPWQPREGPRNHHN